MPDNQAPPPSFGTAELARRMGVSLQTVQRWVDAGELKAWKTPGGHRRIDAASAEAFVRRHLGGDASAPPPLSVLLVEDSPIERTMLERFITRALPQATLRVVDNGLDALVAVGQAMPDLVVTDLMLPHVDGAAMLRRLRREPGTPPAIVVVTSLSTQRIAALGGVPHGVPVLAKPVDPQQLTECLRTLAVQPADQRRALL